MWYVEKKVSSSLCVVVLLCGELIVASLRVKLRTLLCISWHFVVC
jgi:hypothetical protein